VDRAVVRVIRRHAVGKFVHIGLAENDGARLFQLNDDLGVVLRNEIFQNL